MSNERIAKMLADSAAEIEAWNELLKKAKKKG